MAFAEEVFSISGVWIFEFFFVIVFNRRPMLFRNGENLFDESTLGFLCFFCFRGSCRDIWCLDFWFRGSFRDIWCLDL